MAKKTSNIKVARSAKTGRFVKKSYADRHPNTTVVETVKRTGGAPVPKKPEKSTKPRKR